MNLNDYVHIAIANEAQKLLHREHGESVQAFDRRLDKYIQRRLKQVGETLITLDHQRRAQRPDPEVA